MIHVRQDLIKNVPEIGNTVLSSHIENTNAVLAEMARVYLAIGGDEKLSWDTDSKIEIVVDLEQRINALLQTIEYDMHSNVYVEVEHCYGSKEQNEYGTEQSIYELNISIAVDHNLFLFAGNILANYKHDKHLYNLIKQILIVLANNTALSPYTATHHLMQYEDYWDAEDDPDNVENIEIMKEECRLFEEMMPSRKTVPSRIRRLKEIYRAMRQGMDADVAEWLGRIFEYLEFVSCNPGLQSEIEIAIDNAISTTGDDMFSLEYMFVMLWQERTVLVENICNDMDDSYNSGTMLPAITINIKGKEDIERARRIITLLRLFYSIAETAPGGG